jgi:hypothetical protein
LPEGFEASVYLPPVPLSGDGAVTFAACPNPSGLEEFEGFPKETAVDLINNLRSGDAIRMQHATDPALWSLLDQFGTTPEPITLDWLDGKVQRATQSPYADMLTNQCGSEVVRLSWWVAVCPGSCHLNAAEALKSHYFLFWRNGIALIWLVL